MSAEWATVYAETATAISTFLAVAVALFLSGAETRRRARAEERQQAEQISAWMEELNTTDTFADGKLRVKLIVQNSSNQLVYSLIASIVTAQSGARVGARYEYRNYLGRVAPGRAVHTVEHPGGGMHKRFAIELAFEDSFGTTWVRSGKGKLTQIKNDPLGYYGIDPPVGWLMP
jgi:hypothetical protein